MRVRLIRPSYWTDADLHCRLTAEVREFYIGLWMEADDAGFVEWDPIRIGADLYPYRSLSWRKTRLPRWLALLGSHVQLLECGKHLIVPNLTKHQSVPRPSYPNRRAHEKCVSHMGPHGAIWGHLLEGKEKEGKEEGKGSKGGAAAVSLKEKVAAAGYKP